MKKKISSLIIFPLLILTSCGSTTNSSSIESIIEESVSEEASSQEELSEEISSTSVEEVCQHANKQHFDAIEPLCDVGGNLEYYYCGGCNTYFDANMQEADYADLLLDPCHLLEKHDAIIGREVSSQEYYECSRCHRYFNDDEASLEYEEGEWITEGTALHWLNGETIKTKAVNALSLADLEGKAFSFEFKFLEEGYNFINFGQTIANTWTISGTFTLTYENGTYTTDKGIISSVDDEGWATCIINQSEFTGTGPKNHGADGLDVVFGGWLGYTDNCHAEFYIDGESVEICDAHL